MKSRKKHKVTFIRTDSRLDCFLKRKYNSSLFTYQEIFGMLFPIILKMYQAPKVTLSIIYKLVFIGAIAMPLFWSVSNVMPCVLRAAGDSIFSSVVSLITMWVLRVGLGYVFAITLGFGVEGVWICLGIEWAVRTIIFNVRFQSDKWLGKSVI